MVHSPVLRRRPLTALTCAALTVTGVLAATPTSAAPGHTTVVAAAPSALTPDIVDGTVFAIHDAGSKVIVGGSFTGARNRNSTVTIARKYVLAFDKATGAVDTAFAPQVDGEVLDIVAGPTAGTVYLAGKFNTVGTTSRRKLALLNVSNGSLVTSFPNVAFDGLINDVEKVGSRLLVGGIFTKTGTLTRNGLASLNASTGVVDSYLTASLTENHNYRPTETGGAKAGVGAEKLAVSPDGTQLVVIGNFKKADGAPHDQIVRLTLGSTAATVSTWNTTRYQDRCKWTMFDSYVRDVSFSPDGKYFVVANTGGPYAGTLCDAVARWETSSTGSTVQPTWINYSGGDTFLSVGITERAVYVGGHFRWLNNTGASNSAYPGAVARPSIAALDPLNGLPLSWNPGRHPRGYGVAELLVTPAGLWLGSDQPWIGNFKYRRERIAFFPLTGGATPHSTTTAALPGNVYLAGFSYGTVDAVRTRTYDGVGAVGAAATVTSTDGTAWSTVRGGFWVGGTLFYGMNGALWRRTFNGTTFGTATKVDPYHDALWDTVVTGSGPSGQTYAGSTVSFYPEIANVTGMFYSNGRLYYTLSGSSALYWRWFSPDSGTVGADRFTVAGSTGFADSAGVFVSGSSLYLVNRLTGNLSSTGWVNGAPSGTWTVRSGPALDSVDWRAKAIFTGPAL
ncbi:hypothetical protein ACFY2R_05015 [Micromonospora olivasterospora]|uniref:Delta-60 repeat protein n=1 Tax=Micromonospora olivasterospora TaxID=1880 RepID=A0A562I8M2_MICOL|nr:hypothetical protein [Micromonospora olivasterospora]TWH67351.1 hypothetical protein JD77_02326 [Micromonospora olivasterospora]